MKQYFIHKGIIHRAVLRTTKKGLGRKPIWEINTHNTAEIFRIIGQTRPARFVHRIDWWDGACIGRDKNSTAWKKIDRIDSIGKKRMVDIQTSTRTFVANGLVSHNSTMAILKTLWASRYIGMDCLYTLPTDSDMTLFVGSKVNRLIAQNPVLQEFVKDRDTIEQKRVGKQVIYYRGTWTQKAALMVSSDLNVYDEVDRSKQDVVAAYSSRLQHSKYQWEWYFSNPSTPTNGVGKLWLDSDQREWVITCDSCHGPQTLTWPASVDPEGKRFRCIHCAATLTDENRRIGEWRANSEGNYRGYHISLLMAPWTSAAKILELEQSKPADYFANFVLGEPYAITDLPDFRRLFLDCYTTRNLREEPYALGVDIGATKHYVLGSAKGIFQVGKFTDREDLEWLIERYNPTVVMDAGPERTWAEEFRKKYPKLSICFYRRDSSSADIAQWGEDDKRGTVTADRNRLIDHVIDQFLQAHLMVNLPTVQFDEYIRHWMTLERQRTMDTLGVDRYVWESPSGLDHYVHATSYYVLALKKTQPSQFIPEKPEQKREVVERTPDGFRMVDLRDMFSR